MPKQEEQITIVNDVKKVSKWLTLDFSLKLFGVEIIHWHYPPQND